MANAIQVAGGASEPTSFAPLHTSRLITGLWTNRNPLSDAAVSHDMQLYGLGRQDSIIEGNNTELSSKLTLRRRRGTSVYNTQDFPSINRFYSFNTFTTTDENVRVMADTANTVYDATGPNTQNAIWQKTPGAGKTFFLGVGNVLYFCNGIDNKKWNFTTNQVSNWSIAAPTTAPVISQAPRPTPPPSWIPLTGYEAHSTPRPGIIILGSDGCLHVFNGTGTTGGGEPPWTPPGTNTTDGSIQWFNLGPYNWQADFGYGLGEVISGMNLPSDVFYTFVSTTAGRSGDGHPNWPTGLNLQISDGPPPSTPTQPSVIWTNVGKTLQWSDIGAGTTITSTTSILDANGYLQTVIQAGKSAAGPTQPQFGTELGATTQDGTVVWQNTGPWSVGTTAVVQWGYAYKNSQTGDISNMSPASAQISVLQGNQVTVQGNGSPDPQVDTIVIYRIAQGGSLFLYLTEIPAPAGGAMWTYIDNSPDSALDPLIQGAVAGENTPLPQGATCLAYHLQRIFAAVGNVVYVSTGPAAVVQGGNGNSGFNPTNSFTAQSKITHFWVSPLGLVVFTVRDSYIILGSATDNDPLYMTTFVDGLPLRNYDAFTTHLTTPYLMLGTNMVVALDPSAGIIEVSFPIADKIEAEFDPGSSFVTYHSESSKESALYVSDGAWEWYRMAATTAPETGLLWSPRATVVQQMSAMQSVEVLPGTNRLLIGPGPSGGPILKRDLAVNTDNGVPFKANTTLGSIVLAHPGQLAALAFITIEAMKVGSIASLSVLMGEISGDFEPLKRTCQDPPNLPPSDTLYSDRYHFLQSQLPAWCRHFQMDIAWPAEDAPNELLTFTIFGQTWNEFRSQ
jgi:hypothetical protein